MHCHSLSMVSLVIFAMLAFGLVSQTRGAPTGHGSQVGSAEKAVPCRTANDSNCNTSKSSNSSMCPTGLPDLVIVNATDVARLNTSFSITCSVLPPDSTIVDASPTDSLTHIYGDSRAIQQVAVETDKNRFPTVSYKPKCKGNDESDWAIMHPGPCDCVYWKKVERDVLRRLVCSDCRQRWLRTSESRLQCHCARCDE